MDIAVKELGGNCDPDDDSDQGCSDRPDDDDINMVSISQSRIISINLYQYRKSELAFMTS